MSERFFTLRLPDDPTEAQAYLVGRLRRIAEEQVELMAILDELRVPTHQYGQRLTFHQRVAVLTGMIAR